MKTRLETNINGYPLRLGLLFDYAYSDGTDLILSCRNTNEEPGPDFSVFSVILAKGRFEGKSCRYCLPLVAHKTWLKRCMPVIMGSFWSLATKNLSFRAKFKFYPRCLARNVLWISKNDILKKTEKLAIFKSLPLPIGFIYFLETRHICLVVLSYYHEQIRKDLL